MRIIATIRTWPQCSANYDADLVIRTKSFIPADQIAEIIEWAKELEPNNKHPNILLSLDEESIVA